MKKTISVVINARLGSTRVPQKLVRPFSSTNLIEIALSKLNEMHFFEHRFLAVAEDELKLLGKKYSNIEILERDLSAVKKGVNPVEITFEHYLRVPSDYIFVFNPCLPCLKIDTVRKAFDYFQQSNFNSYTAVVPTGDWIFNSEGKALTNSNPLNPTTNKDRTYLKACHAFHIINKNFFNENGILWTFNLDDPHLIEIPEHEAVDVDTENEFTLAEIIYKECR